MRECLSGTPYEPADAPSSGGIAPSLFDFQSQELSQARSGDPLRACGPRRRVSLQSLLPLPTLDSVSTHPSTSKCLVDAHPELRRPMLRYVVKGGPSHGFSLLDGLLSRHSRPYFGEPQSSCTQYFDKHAYELRKVFLFRSLTTYSSQPPKIHCIHVFCRTQPIYNPAPTQAMTDKSPCTMEARQVSVRCAIRQSHLGQGHREWQTPLTITFGSCRLETSRAPSSYKNYHAHSWTIPSFFCAINTRKCEIALLYMGRLLWNVASV